MVGRLSLYIKHFCQYIGIFFLHILSLSTYICDCLSLEWIFID